MTDLPRLGAEFTEESAFAINERGQIVGSTKRGYHPKRYAVLWTLR
jgi:uncharacterized membrane protein